jgi:hypothetical protein
MDLLARPDATTSPERLTLRQRRRALIEITRRRILPGSGSSPEFLQRRTAMTRWPDLRPVLQGLPWAIAGGAATRAYMPERVTRDLDILVRAEDGDTVRQRMEAAGYVFSSRLGVPGFLMHSPEGTELDVVLGDTPWLDEALAHPEVDAAGYPVLALPYLTLMKLQAGRLQDSADIARMLALASAGDLEQVRRVVSRYAPEDRDDLESLIELGKLELGTAD